MVRLLSSLLFKLASSELTVKLTDCFFVGGVAEIAKWLLCGPYFPEVEHRTYSEHDYIYLWAFSSSEKNIRPRAPI